MCRCDLLASVSANMKYSVCLAVIVLLVFGGCSGQGRAPSNPANYAFSFEKDMEGWIAAGTNLDDPLVEWCIERSRDIATDGKTSIRLYLNNMNGAGKIWVERRFDVNPSCAYEVRVEYDLASADWGDVNLWTIITGVVPESPKKEPVFQENTGNNAPPEDGFAWLRKTYDFTMESGPDGKLFVMIGVWGTWETARTYYVDNIAVTLGRHPKS